MEDWKKALLAGSAAGAVIMLLKGKTLPATVFAGIGLVTLAAEYPEEFAKVRDRLPEYLDRGSAFIDTASRLGERLAQTAERRGVTWYEALLSR